MNAVPRPSMLSPARLSRIRDVLILVLAVTLHVLAALIAYTSWLQNRIHIHLLTPTTVTLAPPPKNLPPMPLKAPAPPPKPEPPKAEPPPLPPPFTPPAPGGAAVVLPPAPKEPPPPPIQPPVQPPARPPVAAPPPPPPPMTPPSQVGPGENSPVPPAGAGHAASRPEEPGLKPSPTKPRPKSHEGSGAPARLRNADTLGKGTARLSRVPSTPKTPEQKPIEQKPIEKPPEPKPIEPAPPSPLPASPTASPAGSKGSPGFSDGASGGRGTDTKKPNADPAKNAYDAEATRFISTQIDTVAPQLFTGIRQRLTVIVTIRPDGFLLWATMAPSSGNSELDSAVIDAVESIGQFPPVPPNLVGPDRTYSIRFSFTYVFDNQ